MLTLAGTAAACRDRSVLDLATAQVGASARYVNFGATTLGVPARQIVTIFQEGRVAADLVSVQFEPDSGAYSLPTLPARLELGQHFDVLITYRPLQAGRDVSVMKVTVRNGAPVQITLDGRGVDARAVPQNTLDFGRPAVGAVRQRSLVLRNDEETLVPAYVSFAGPDADQFTGPVTVDIPPFSETSAVVGFLPAGPPGLRRVTVRLVACPLCAPVDLPVVADAVAVPIVVTPSPVQLGAVAVDTERHVPLQLTNATDELITLSEVVLAAGTDPGFGLDGAQLPLPLLPLTPEFVGLTFTPTRLGNSNGTLILTSDAAPTPTLAIPLSAGAGGAQLVVTPLNLTFKPTPAGAVSAATFTVENGGADPSSPPLHVTGMTVDPGVFTVPQPIAAGTALAAGQQLTISVEFAPPTPATYQSSITVTSDDPINPQFVISLSGVATPSVSCVLQVMPPAISFGDVPVGDVAILGPKITNIGTQPCNVWNNLVSGDPSFSLTKPRGLLTLQPGDEFTTPVAFEPTTSTDVSGTLSFQTSEASLPTLLVPLSGGSDPATCLQANPAFLNFASDRIGCAVSNQSTTWTNTCAQPVALQSIALGPGTEAGTFQLVSAPATPMILAPGAQATAVVELTPQLPGYSMWPLFATASDSPLPHPVPVAAEILTASPFTQTFVQTTPGKVDLLWVIDNTASMKDKRTSLSNNIASFLQLLDAQAIDYQIGVTTTGIDPAPPSNGTPACPGGAEGGEAGRLFPVDNSNPRIVTPSMANRATVLAQNIQVGGCQSVQQGIRATELGLSPPVIDNATVPNTPQPDDGNLGFTRPDAALAVVAVSDEDDQSPGTVPANVQTLLGLKPETPMTFSAIVTPAAGCPIGTQPGLRYLQTVASVGGAAASICDTDWSQSLATIAAGLFRPRQSFPLSNVPDPSTLVVTVDGQPASGWSYDGSTNSVTFVTPPAPGAQIQVQYEQPCSGP